MYENQTENNVLKTINNNLETEHSFLADQDEMTSKM